VSVASADVQATFAATLVDEWVRGGVVDAVVCPGSRSTPMAVALAASPEITVHVRLDERSAGFFAIGLAAATARAVVVLTTSGTAAAELHPSVVEAHHHGVPLIVCTADRPPELQGVGAPQTIDQRSLFGPALRWSCSPGVPEVANRAGWRSVGSRLVAEATCGPYGPGPVHANLAFREPLSGNAEDLPAGRAGGAPWHTVLHGSSAPPGIGSEVASRAGARGLIVAGAGAAPAGGERALVSLAERLGWPLLADPLSRCRLDRGGVVAAADALLRDDTVRRALRPDVVLQIGEPWASRVLGEYVAEAAAEGAEMWAVDPHWQWRDPHRIVGRVMGTDPGAFVAATADALGADEGQRSPVEWTERWRLAEEAAQAVLDEVLGDPASLDEPSLARRLPGSVEPGTTVVASSSMPIRDLEWYGPKLAAPPRVWANRGANGIDGVISTALGWAAAGSDPVVAVVGDLAFLHDLSALVSPADDGGRRSRAPCTVVVVDNGGGGIFSFLPQARALPPEPFERLFGTPMATSVSGAARGLGVEAVDVATAGELEDALRLPHGATREPRRIVRVAVPPRADNVALHDRLHSAVGAAASRAIGT